ncbi:MAG: hypothetical protein II337_10240 [Clostridia bacterium]|nr:hypothetical protein [Clostridia bacterium]
MIPESVFEGYSLRTENRTNRVYVAQNGTRAAYDACLRALAAEGFAEKERFESDRWCYAALLREDTGIFLNYYSETGDLRAAVEERCAYFSYNDDPADRTVSPQITQIPLEDYGMSYAVRLSDGRFVIFDGGWNFAPDAERLYACLQDGSQGRAPIVAAWILTHAHRDHYQCFLGFMERYGDAVTVEKVLLSFPEADDPAYEKDFSYEDRRVPDSDERTNIPRLWQAIASCGAVTYTAHTGQRYRMGDADCLVLSSFDDVVGDTANINATSLVIRMELGGQVILWTGDAAFGICRLPQRYGADLKADILQVPHHGFQSGPWEDEILGYDRIRPSVCLLPVSDHNAYTAFCIHRRGTRHLMQNCDVSEFIAASSLRTLTLPYVPAPYGKAELARNCAEGLAACGAKCWIFTGLSTASPSDFVFDFLNTTYLKPNLNAEIYFEDRTKRILHVRFSLPPTCTKSVNVVGDEVDGDALWFNEYALKTQPIPENAPFSLRITSDLPIVVSHPDHAPAYHA